MGNLSFLQVDEDKTFQDVVVEDQIDVEVAGIGEDMFLSGDKGKSPSHLDEELL